MSNEASVPPSQTHAHTWKPVQGEVGTYQCEGCPATGYRVFGGPNKGQIVPHVKNRVYGSPKQTMHVSAEWGAAHARHGKRGPGGW